MPTTQYCVVGRIRKEIVLWTTLIQMLKEKN